MSIRWGGRTAGPGRDMLLIAGDLAEETGEDGLAAALRWMAGHGGPGMGPTSEILMLAAARRLVPGARTAAGSIVLAPGIARIALLLRLSYPPRHPTVELEFDDIVAVESMRAIGPAMSDPEGRLVMEGGFIEGALDVAMGSTLRIVVSLQLGRGSIHSMAKQG